MDDQIDCSEHSNDDIVSYLEAKQQMLTAYCANIAYYVRLKVCACCIYKADDVIVVIVPWLVAVGDVQPSQALGKPVDDHPVIHKLLELRFVIEKMRPLDGKLKHQIDRLLRMSASESEVNNDNVENMAALRPNILSMVGGEGEGESEENGSEGDSDDADPMTDKKEKYVAPKLVSMHFEVSLITVVCIVKGFLFF